MCFNLLFMVDIILLFCNNVFETAWCFYDVTNWWWRHAIKNAFFTNVVRGIGRLPLDPPHKRTPVRSFDFFLVIDLYMLLKQQSISRWYETPGNSRNVYCNIRSGFLILVLSGIYLTVCSLCSLCVLQQIIFPSPQIVSQLNMIAQYFWLSQLRRAYFRMHYFLVGQII